MHKKLYSLLVVFLFLANQMRAQLIITTIAGDGGYGTLVMGTPATAAELSLVFGIALDSKGYIVFNNNNYVLRMDTTGTITEIAGGAGTPYSGDGGPATAAVFYNSAGVAVDKDGNVYIADMSNQRIRKVDTFGIITTFAGNGTEGYSGDGAPATDAELNNPYDICVGDHGNIYIADASYAIRMVDTMGIIHTVAGTGTYGYTGDGGPATAANIAADGVAYNKGNIYFCDKSHCVIRKIDTGNIVTTIGGTTSAPYSGDGGPATAAGITFPTAIAVDTSGNVFIITSNRVREIDTSGTINTIAGSLCTGGVAGCFYGDHCAATAAAMAAPEFLVVDKYGNIYVTDANNHRIRKIAEDVIPSFVHGKKQTVALCLDTSFVAIALDTTLQINDADPAETETWSVLTPPTRGSLSVSYATTSTGGMLVPSGTSYTPAFTFGVDSFQVLVADCGNAMDTATIYVRLDSFPFAGHIIGDTVTCPYGTLMADTIAGGIWSNANQLADSVDASGIAYALSVGVHDTIFYTVTNSCGSVAASFLVITGPCEGGVHNVANGQPSMQILPNPNNGTFAIHIVNDKIEPTTLVVLDMMGAKVRTYEFSTSVSENIVSDLSPGLYIVSVHTSNGVYFEKLVVE